MEYSQGHVAGDLRIVVEVLLVWKKLPEIDLEVPEQEIFGRIRASNQAL